MSSSGPHATANNGAARSLYDLAFTEPFARKLASLASSNQPNSRLALLSCLAEMTLREEFPDTAAAVHPTTSGASFVPTGADRERAAEKWPQFESGECVRVAAESDPKSCKELTIADLKVFPRHIAEDGCLYPVLTKSGDRVIVCVRECGRSTWRHGFVANMKNMPPISTGGGQYAYPVVYQKSPRAVGYFKVSRGEIFYDAVLSSGMDIDPYGLD
ncbi:hypothetical protein L227DRAFT_611997 [Lentinus tigrinus ALCF2SS1-6]|uniref:Uncharacterized protein n=1 Tax=Lentinus tigrinus ALCF2SS1-6 TaxID=1328759 RepID=A0A5C2S6E6_9APHY|nr:hypothetical protein L227DRAFT_611997 [Lentinus tigrinus ALCF2SS1-6]